MQPDVMNKARQMVRSLDTTRVVQRHNASDRLQEIADENNVSIEELLEGAFSDQDQQNRIDGLTEDCIRLQEVAWDLQNRLDGQAPKFDGDEADPVRKPRKQAVWMFPEAATASMFAIWMVRFWKVHTIRYAPLNRHGILMLALLIGCIVWWSIGKLKESSWSNWGFSLAMGLFFLYLLELEFHNEVVDITRWTRSGIFVTGPMIESAVLSCVFFGIAFGRWVQSGKG
jgi:hypothetical protein